MPNVVHYLALQELGLNKNHKFIENKKAVLDILEYEAAKPVHNQPCHISGESRATFLVDFSPNMLLAASTHGDHTVRVTDIQKGKCTHILTGHPRTPWCLAFNPTSNDILASGCLGGEVRIWDLLGGGSEILQNPSAGAVITSLAFHPSGQVLVFATVNCIYFWDWTKPVPFAVTKTSHEFERIRWLRFDPFGHYLFTGIANNTTVHGETGRNVIHMRRDNVPSESRSSDISRRRRYNRLMQRYQAFRQRVNPSSDYPEYINPRSPVHEENLNIARQYAGHVTEAAALRNTQTNFSHGSGRPAGHRLQSLLSSRAGETQRESIGLDSLASEGYSAAHPVAHPETRLTLGGTSSANGAATVGTLGEAERNPRRRWGRYQPSFFTSDRNNNDRLGYDNNNNDYSQQNPNLISLPLNQPDQAPPSSWHMTSTSAFSPWVAESSGSGPSNALGSNEFEILPVDQSEGTGVSSVTPVSSAFSENWQSNSENQHRELQSLLRRYRTTLSVLASSSSATSSSNSITAPSTSLAGYQSFPGIYSNSRQTSSTSNGSQFISSQAPGPLAVLSTSTSAGLTTSSSDALVSSSNISVPVTSCDFTDLNQGRGAVVTSSSSTESSALNSTSTVGESSLAMRRQQPLLTVFISRSSSVPQTSSSLATNALLTSSSGQTSSPAIDRDSLSPGTFLFPERSDLYIPGLADVHHLDSPFINLSSPSDHMNQSIEPGNRDRHTIDTDQGQMRMSRNSISQGNTCSISESHMDSIVPFYNGLPPTSAQNQTSAILANAGNTNPMTSQSTGSQSASCVAGPSGSRADSHVPFSCGVADSINACSSSGSHANSSSNLLNIPKGHLLRTKLSEVTVTTASGLTSSRNHLPNTSSTIVIHPADSLTFSSSDNHNLRANSRSIFSGGRGDLVVSAPSASNSSSALSSQGESGSNPQRAQIPIGTPFPFSISSQCHSNQETHVNAQCSRQRRQSQAEVNTTSTNSVPSDPVAEVQERLQQAVQQLRDVQSRVQELTSSSTYSANLAHAASVTEYLEQRVSDLDRRISDLEQRVESSGYLLSNNPFYQSHISRRRHLAARSHVARDHSSEHLPANLDSQRRRHAGHSRRNQLLMNYLVNTGSSRAPQSHRTLSFNLSSAHPASSSSSSTMPGASLAHTSGGAAASASLPLSITIHQADQEREEDADFSMLGDDTGFRRRGGSGNQESDWRSLQQIHLHPDYSSSILDDTINRPNEAMQQIMSRTIAGAFLSRDEQAVANNIVPQTHRIQRWEVSKCIVPDISDASENIVVEHCKLHNDASCDISRDSSALATFVPSHRGFPDDNILGVFSLQKETFGQCLFTKSFGPNAISVSISPANHYVMVGLAAKRCFFFATPSQLVGQVYQLVKKKAGEKSMKHITDLYHPCNRGHQGHISVNSGRWLPGIGEGIVYGTNRGDLHFCRPGPRKVPECETPECRGIQLPDLSSPGWRLQSAVRSNMATQTTAINIRRSSSTQTPGEELSEA